MPLLGIKDNANFDISSVHKIPVMFFLCNTISSFAIKLKIEFKTNFTFCSSRGGQNFINIKVCTAYQIAMPFYLSKLTINPDCMGL